ncbi:oligopeptide ABC transporter permease OppB [Pseudooctadecabacter sp.]|uniref:oligopeptide ABC transporter permease OppB n=1 Tax=Pseudooctadecabacter sp. TaxID=1966338 RepID=UPI0035C83B6C
MFAYIVRRLAIAVPTLLILVIFSFVLMFAAPGGPFDSERPLPPEVMANVLERYGLDQPYWKQMFDYVKNVVLYFDFGPSFQYRDRTVNDVIAQGFPVTLTYGAWSALVAVVVGVSLGVAAALRQNTWLDYLAVGITIGAQALPNFVMAPLLVLFFTLMPALYFGEPWLPGGGWNGGQWDHVIMPVIALSTSYMASIARITRSSMLETLNSNFIRTARAKGLPMRRVVWRHAMKPAMLPVISYVGVAVVGMITGSVVVDVAFSTGGIGQFFVNSAFNRDYAVIMGITVLVGALTILFNLLVDILYAWLDPKIRY